MDMVLTMSIAVEMHPDCKETAAKICLQNMLKRLATKPIRKTAKKALKSPYKWLRKEQTILGKLLLDPEVMRKIRHIQ
jgi:hypothetical protein